MKVVPDGIYYTCGLALAGCALSYFLNPWAGWPCFVLALYCLYFFRDPDRVPPPGDVLVAPADGKVVSVREIALGEMRVSIFLNIFNVHVNRTPLAGTIADIRYQKGKFLVASHEAASAENEQNTLLVEGDGTRVLCRQIAGLIARRIVCYKRPGDILQKGERIGYIKFGSRVDVLFGPEWRPVVKVGDRVSAGSSVLANRRPAEEAL